MHDCQSYRERWTDESLLGGGDLELSSCDACRIFTEETRSSLHSMTVLDDLPNDYWKGYQKRLREKILAQRGSARAATGSYRQWRRVAAAAAVIAAVLFLTHSVEPLAALVRAMIVGKQPVLPPPSSAAPPVVIPPSTTATVEGLVTGHGAPSPYVNITFTPEYGEPLKFGTDENGLFRADRLPPGRYTVSLFAFGLSTSRNNAGPLHLNLVAGQHVANVHYRLDLPGVISGVVQDDNGLVENADVAAFKIAYTEDGRRVLARVASLENGAFRKIGGRGNSNGSSGVARSNSDGTYRLIVEPGEYYVGAAYLGTVSNGPTTFFPSARNALDGVPILVPEGTEVPNMDIRMSQPEKENLYTLRVRVQDANSSMKLGGGITAYPVDPTLLTETIAGSTGNRNPENPNDNTYEVSGLPTGLYNFWFLGMSNLTSAFFTANITNRDIDFGTLNVHPIGVRGRIQNLSVLPATLDQTRLRVQLRTMAPANYQALPKTARIGADGGFLFPDNLDPVVSGKYELSIINLPTANYVASARDAYGTEYRNNIIELVEQPISVALTLGSSVSVVEGSVRGRKDEFAADSTVVLIPAPDRRSSIQFYRVQVTDQNGTFSIRGIPAGSYSLLAWEDVRPNAWYNAEFLKAYESRAIKISVQNGSKSTVSLRVIPAVRP